MDFAGGETPLLVDLIQVRTRDEVRLDGIFQKAALAGGPGAVPLDAVCCVHGTGGNFYSSSLFEFLSARLLALGCSVLRVNTRGHDLISTAAVGRGGRRLGAAYEVVADCRHDVAAWLDWLRQQGYPRIGLLGHSLGAVKCLYALAQEPELAPVCLIALSPPRLSYSWFCQSQKAETFLKTYHHAESLVAAGQPGALLEVSVPLPFVITAAGYVEKYGPEERYNFVNFVAGMPCPLLITFGGLEVVDNMAFQGSPEALDALPRRPQGLTVQIIPGGDHFYTAARPELAQCVDEWLRGALPE